MNRQRNVIMIALFALVTGSAALVYAKDVHAKDSEKAATSAPKVLYNLSALPNPVQQMLREIIVTAEAGDIEAMRPVLESNELKPMVAATHVDDPIAYWKKQSADGTGRDVLAAMLNTLSSGFVRSGKGYDEAYVWPYFAEADINKLTPAQEVEFYRTVPPKIAASIKKSGKYDYYRLGISPKGVWHYFIK